MNYIHPDFQKVVAILRKCNVEIEPSPLIEIFLEKEIPLKIRIDFKSLGNTYGLLFDAQREPF